MSLGIPHLAAATAAALGLLSSAAAFAPAPLPRAEKPVDPAGRVARMMEGYRSRIPPPQGLVEQNGLTVRELEPYLMSHLAGVARRMGVKTRAECAALIPYLKDRDVKLRYIALQALSSATGAYPNGISVGWLLDTTSEGHAAMTRRLEALIGRMSP